MRFLKNRLQQSGKVRLLGWQSSGYLDSADTRDQIHQQKVDDQAVLTHNAKIFSVGGVKGGRTKADKAGDRSECFYKGTCRFARKGRCSGTLMLCATP